MRRDRLTLQRNASLAGKPLKDGRREALDAVSEPDEVNLDVGMGADQTLRIRGCAEECQGRLSEFAGAWVTHDFRQRHARGEQLMVHNWSPSFARLRDAVGLREGSRGREKAISTIDQIEGFGTYKRGMRRQIPHHAPR